MWRTVRIHHIEVGDLSSTCMNGLNVHDRSGHDTRQFHPSFTAGKRTVNIPGPASQNELVLDRTIPIILLNGNNILADKVFKISIVHTNLDTSQIQSRLGSRVCLFATPNTSVAGYPTKK